MTKYNLPVTKEEIASELGVKLGADRTSRENGSVGGRMVKKIFEQFGPKQEIASELGVKLGADTSRENGSVGGRMG